MSLGWSFGRAPTYAEFFGLKMNAHIVRAGQAQAFAWGQAAYEGDPGLAYFDAIADDPEEAKWLHAARRGELMQREAMQRQTR